MITMRNWHVHVPENEQSIGYTGENLVFRFQIETDDAPPDWVYRLDVKYQNGDKNFLLLNYNDGILWCDILREHLQNGRLTAQVRALRDEQEKHSNVFSLVVFNSIQALNAFEKNDPSAFAQLEQRLNLLQQEAEESAQRAESLTAKMPVIHNGNWWIYDPAVSDYVDSGFAAQGEQGNPGPPGEPGPQGEKGDVYFASFAADPETGLLTMYTPAGYEGPSFRLNNGYLEVSVIA